MNTFMLTTSLTKPLANVAACAAAGAAVLTAVPATSAAADTWIRVPCRADAGDVVAVRGAGWAWGEAGDVYWVEGDIHLADFVTDEHGRFEAEFVVPDVEPGRYEVAAWGESTESVVDTITVTTRDAPRRPEAARRRSGDLGDDHGEGPLNRHPPTVAVHRPAH